MTGSTPPDRCPGCGSPTPEGARFCPGCGTHLGSIQEAERRIITVLFADLTGFTGLTERLDPEQVREVIAECLDPLSACVARWGGFVDKFIGDCVMALFGAPVAYEDEAERAVRAALDMQEAFRAWATSGTGGPKALLADAAPRLRIGINTGPVVTGVFSGGGARDYTAVGDTVNVAARLQGECEPGGVLVGPATYEQTRHLFEFGDELVLQVRGRAEAVRTRYVLGLLSRRGTLRGFRDRRPPLIGREGELRALRERWHLAGRGRFQVCLILGAPGIGKSRLVEELIAVERLGSDEVAWGRSQAEARGTPWEPIAELLRDLYSVSVTLPPAEAAAEICERGGGSWGKEDVAGLALALGSPAAEVPELESAQAAERNRRVAAAVLPALGPAAGSRKLLVLDDLHWADPTTLGFLAGLSGIDARGSSLLLLVARPALAGEDALADLIGRDLDRIELGPLDAEQTEELIAAVLGDHLLPQELVREVIGRTEGNPLFVEEILESMADADLLSRDDSGAWRWVGDPGQLEIPDTIESVLSTRIDALDPSTRRVLQYAAIVGRRFWSSVLAEAMAQRPVERELERLVSSALVRALPESTIAGDREFAFEHLLLQEVAYGTLLRGLRAEHHGAVARWLEGRAGDLTGDGDELVAYHFERSEEPQRALPYLERAARRAWKRGALGETEALLERARGVAATPEQKVPLLVLSEEVAAGTGDARRRREAIEKLAGLGRELGDAAIRAEAAFRLARSLLDGGQLEEARKVADDALAGFQKLEDESRRGDVLALLGRIAHQWGDYPTARRHYGTSLRVQRGAHDRKGEAETLVRLGLVEVDHGNFTSGLERFEAALLLCRELGDRPLEARVLAHRATALRWLGRLEEAEEAARAGMEAARRCGSARAEATASLSLGQALAAGTRRADAEAILSDVCRTAEDMHRPGLGARAWLLLADLATGREGRQRLARARELAAASGLVHVEVLARTRQAALALEEGDPDTADRASAAALEGLRRHGNIQGPEEQVFFVRARVLSALGREAEAEALYGEARRIVEEKAALIPDPAERRRYLEELPPNPEILSSGVAAAARPAGHRPPSSAVPGPASDEVAGGDPE